MMAPRTAAAFVDASFREERRRRRAAINDARAAMLEKNDLLKYLKNLED